MIVNAEGQVLGRMASFVAKRALLGDDVIIVNAEKALVSGKRGTVLGKELDKLGIRNLGNPRKGPFHQKRPDRYVRRAIRGMLPWKKPRGREAFKRVQVYVGFPEGDIKKKHSIEDIKTLELSDMKKDFGDYTTVAEICRFIGGKW